MSKTTIGSIEKWSYLGGGLNSMMTFIQEMVTMK